MLEIFWPIWASLSWQWLECEPACFPVKNGFQVKKDLELLNQVPAEIEAWLESHTFFLRTFELHTNHPAVFARPRPFFLRVCEKASFAKQVQQEGHWVLRRSPFLKAWEATAILLQDERWVNYPDLVGGKPCTFKTYDMNLHELYLKHVQVSFCSPF